MVLQFQKMRRGTVADTAPSDRCASWLFLRIHRHEGRACALAGTGGDL